MIPIEQDRLEEAFRALALAIDGEPEGQEAAFLLRLTLLLLHRAGYSDASFAAIEAARSNA